MKNRILPVFFLCFFYSAFSQGFTVTADKKRILIGEQLQLQLASNFPSGKPLSWFSIDSLPHFEILERSAVDTQQNNNITILSQNFILTSWDSGSWQIPSLVLAGSKSAPIKIDVVFSPFDPNQPYHDVKDIIIVRKPVDSKWYWYLIFAIILVLLFILFFPKAKEKERSLFESDPGAYKTAIKKLGQLQAQSVTDPKLFYTELIHIFRTYLHKRKNIQSFSKTTDDLAIQMERLKMGEDDYRELLQTLRLSDLVKFAQYTPAAQDNKMAIETIRDNITHIEQLPHAV